jgi:peptidoglycan hydrolase-like protein with peptidoglycan-binding domain
VSRSLRVGSEGDDVKRLQQFLALDPAIYPERLVTGYYGALTEAAVKRFQCKNKIVCEGTPESTGYGVTGPRTAAILALQCPAGGTPQAETGAVGGFMRVSPISGAAPLNVSIEATVNTTNSCATAVYEIDFGDNTAPGQITVPSGTCHELRQVFNHGYNAPGAYTISLRSGVHRTTATVTVSGSQVTQPTTVPDTFAATPTSGTAPFPVVFQGTINGAAKCNTGSYTLDFGNGQTAMLPVSGCTPNSYTVTHTYTTAGNFVAKLRRNDGTEVGSVAVAATGSTGTQSGGGSYGGFFSVSPSTDGNFSTVTVQFDLETPCTPYDLDWGDASTHVTQSGGSCPGGVDDKQFSHTYSNAGSYTLILKRGTNLAEVDTAGITISN